MNEQPPESITNTLDMPFNMIPAGTFLMGSPETEAGRERLPRNTKHRQQLNFFHKLICYNGKKQVCR